MQKTFDQFKKAFAGAEDQLDACLQLMTQLKIALLDFSSLPPATADGSATAQQELTLAREILEHGAMLSIKAMDIPSFERYVAQLKVYYTDCATHLPESQRQFPILGLNLLRLLAQNRIAEFHTELEQIPMALQQSNVYIKFPAQVASRTHRQSPLTPLSQRSARPTDRPPAPMPQLEQHIMEGSYNKVLSAKQDGQYAKEGMFFMDMLVDTVRDEIAECSEKAYTSIKLADLQALLMLGSEAELREFAETVPWPSALPSPSCPWNSCIYLHLSIYLSICPGPPSTASSSAERCVPCGRREDGRRRTGTSPSAAPQRRWRRCRRRR